MGHQEAAYIITVAFHASSRVFPSHLRREDIVTHDTLRHEMLLLDIDYLSTWLSLTSVITMVCAPTDLV